MYIAKKSPTKPADRGERENWLHILRQSGADYSGFAQNARLGLAPLEIDRRCYVSSPQDETSFKYLFSEAFCAILFLTNRDLYK
jgi:hypothetical protein